ncbi:MAG: alpha/beta hydrolase [Rhodobacteraceae bacterium CG17_big_fil_post_rev_8_21_14_2_50_65_11]|nr:MAG: alpha/beta hydrolase [Rhodobacteraceae bacterium CG17_big_fil_post_rev_8_21_14_2_50_65_11]
MNVAPLAFALAMLPALAVAEDRWMEIPPAPAMPDATESGLVPVNGIEMYHAVYGEDQGTPILMIHGGLGHGDLWAAQVADLMQDHRVIVADTRGHGRSTNDGSAYSYDLLAADYLALLDHLGIDEVHLVGWSDGANIGYALSTSAPERLASHFAHAGNVTLDGIDPSVDDDEVFAAYVGTMAEDYAAMSPTPEGFDEFLGGIVEMWSTENPGGLASLSDVTVPTLVVQSEFDEAILTQHSEAIAARIPGASLLVLNDVSHFAAFQDPEGYTAAIRAFIDAQ